MEKSATAGLLSILIALSSLTGCDFIERRRLLKKCVFRLESVGVEAFSLNGVTMLMMLSISNPNKIEVALDRMDLYLYIDNRKTMNVRFNAITIPPGETKKIDADVSIPYAALGMTIAGKPGETGSLRYRLAGHMYVKTRSGFMRLPVTVYKN
ncbi:MAG: LEA type 2 family protein [Spirochaetes bacterium]|nr:LEA type 2 family protein [Spirochaetota bacterium]